MWSSLVERSQVSRSPRLVVYAHRPSPLLTPTDQEHECHRSRSVLVLVLPPNPSSAAPPRLDHHPAARTVLPDQTDPALTSFSLAHWAPPRCSRPWKVDFDRLPARKGTSDSSTASRRHGAHRCLCLVHHLVQAGIIAGSKAGDQRATDTRDDEKERGITIKSTAISMYFELEQENVSLVQQKVDGMAAHDLRRLCWTRD